MKAFKYLLIVVFLYQFGNVYAQDTLRIKVMTYNIRFGELASLEELASHIKSFNLDFVALQEIDCKTDRGERAPHQIGRDYISELAYFTKMFGVYGKTIDYKGGYYGIGILSRYPYIDTKKTFLPWPNKAHERRALLEGLFEIRFVLHRHIWIISCQRREKHRPLLLPSISMIIDTLWF